MELEAGMYVRTKKGIFQIRNKDVFIEDKKQYIGVNGRYTCIDIETIEKASHNIIDLIEENDYIRIITSAYFEPVYYSYGKLVIRDDIPIENYSNDFIREVITKEQFEAMAYKVV